MFTNITSHYILDDKNSQSSQEKWISGFVKHAIINNYNKNADVEFCRMT